MSNIDTNDLRREWIAALRSRKYLQGRGFLAHGDRHCCLGVACRIYQNHFNDLEITDQEGWTYFDGERSLLPAKVIKAFGFTSENPQTSGYSLSYLNDHCRSLVAIADIVEREWNLIFEDING